MNRIPLSEQTKIKRVLDQAIATVAEQEFNRLRSGLSDAWIAERVKKALESMGELQSGGQPEYSEWDALFYVTWYQPRQINLALTILQELFEDARKRLKSNFLLEIIDVGCGALAVQFAMAILATEYEMDGNDVTVNGMDPSGPMKKIGEELWLEFWSILSEQPHLSHLSQTCDYMANNCEHFDSCASYFSSECGRSWVESRPECWIMVLHAIFESNKFKIKRTLEILHGQFSPNVTLVTCHESRRDIARFVIGGSFRDKNLHSDELAFRGQLHKTTDWRRCLVNRLPENPLNSVKGLLFSPVEWAPDKTTAVVKRIMKGD